MENQNQNRPGDSHQGYGDSHGDRASYLNSQNVNVDRTTREKIPSHQASGGLGGTSDNCPDGINEIKHNVKTSRELFLNDLWQLHSGYEQQYTGDQLLTLYRCLVTSYDAYHTANKFLLEMIGQSDPDQAVMIYKEAEDIDRQFNEAKNLVDKALRDEHASTVTTRRQISVRLGPEPVSLGQRPRRTDSGILSMMPEDNREDNSEDNRAQDNREDYPRHGEDILPPSRVPTPMPNLPVTMQSANRMYNEGLAALSERFRGMNLTEIEDSESSYQLNIPSSPPPPYSRYEDNQQEIDSSLYGLYNRRPSGTVSQETGSQTVQPRSIDAAYGETTTFSELDMELTRTGDSFILVPGSQSRLDVTPVRHIGSTQDPENMTPRRHTEYSRSPADTTPRRHTEFSRTPGDTTPRRHIQSPRDQVDVTPVRQTEAFSSDNMDPSRHTELPSSYDDRIPDRQAEPEHFYTVNPGSTHSYLLSSSRPRQESSSRPR